MTSRSEPHTDSSSLHQPEAVDVPIADGSVIRVLDWGGPGPPVLLLHPNGFCGGLYEPIARQLGDLARAIAIDLPGHGGSTTPRDRTTFRFQNLAARVLEVLDQLELGQLAGVGGSLGGAVAILVNRLDPGRWTRLLLAEPVAFPPGAFPQHTENPMSSAARRRRRTFSSRAEMIDTYRNKDPLSQLAPEALDSYVRWGTFEDSEGVQLACDPETEAAIFDVSASAGGAPDAWHHLDALSCPTTIVSGRDSFLPDIFAAQAQRAGSDYVQVPGGHFVLHENTRRGAELITRHTL